MGLKIDDKGGITYHGATSLFNLPSDPHKHKADSLSSIDSDAHRRERLVNNAWHQRAMENLSDIPVCLSKSSIRFFAYFPRNPFNIS